MEEKIYKLQQFQESVIANANIWITVLDQKGNILVWNDAAEAISGYVRGEVLGNNRVWKYMYPEKEYRQKVTSEILRIIGRDTYLENFETEIHCADGTQKTIVWNTRGIRDPTGTIQSYIAIGRDITKQKRVEETLRETTEYLQNLFDYANAPIITWDPGFHITRFNHAFEHLTGRSQEEVLGKTLDLLFPDESRKASMALIQNTLVGERWETVEIPIFNIDGSTKTVLWNSANVLDSEGKLTATIAQGVDITERKRADAALKVSEHKYRTLVENIPEKIFVKDALLAYVSCNDPYARDLGIAAEAIAGKTDFDFYPRDLAEKYRADDRAVMESGATSTIDERYVLNGVEFWVSTLKTPIRDNAGNISGILGIFHDITEKKRAEEVLRESEERYRTLAEASPDQIFIVGRDDTMKYLNTTSLKLFHLSYDEVVGAQRKTLFPPDIAEAQGIVLKKVFETGEQVQTEEKIQFGTQELWIDTHSVPLKDTTGNVIAVLGIARDITDRKLMDSEIRSLNMSLEQRVIERTSQLNASLEDKIILLREKEILLREIHHRVRNTIQLAVSMMEIQVRRENDERVREVIHNTQNRLNAIASTFDKLYYSENMSRVNLQQVVNAIVGALKTAYGTGKRTIQTDIHIDFAELGVDLALPLALIASELVNNSFQHAFPDGRGGMVTITGSEDGEGRIIMTVSDNGSGLPEGFNPAESGTTGLALVRILVQQIRGTLRYETSGKGTSFVITVPRDAESNKSGVSEV